MTTLLSQPAASAATSRHRERDIVSGGRSVIEIEAAALLALASSLDRSFARAVELMLGVRGRIVVTGMGKSGHIGRKVVATLSATGSPALFLHPAEAAHGDLGMLVAGDALLIFSNSGGTMELGPIILRAKALGIPVIGVASRAASPVMRQSDVRLLLPPVGGTSLDDIAPTTSSVMMLAIGDALAMALMTQQGIARDDLCALHPGGDIGLKMTPHPVTMPVTGVAPQAMELLRAHKITSLFVTSREDPDRPLGLVHVHDLLRLGLS